LYTKIVKYNNIIFDDNTMILYYTINFITVVYAIVLPTQCAGILFKIIFYIYLLFYLLTPGGNLQCNIILETKFMFTYINYWLNWLIIAQNRNISKYRSVTGRPNKKIK